jgi:SanA protein
MKHKGWKFLGAAAILLLFVVALITIANRQVNFSTAELHSNNIAKVPSIKVCLLLGTSKKLKNGSNNLYFTHRIEAALQLWKAKKVKAFIVSGDNHLHTYNEADDMRLALVQSGVPDSVIYSDFAGLRTLDSVVRANEIFGQDSILIVSQEFHNQRAVFIANHKGIFGFGYDAPDVTYRYGFKTRIREYFARIKVLFDLYVFQTKPHFLGEPIRINL